MPRNRTPLREQTFRLLPIAIGAVCLFVLLLVVADTVFIPAHIPLTFLVVAGVVVLALLFGATAVGLVVGRRIVGDHLEVAMRAPGEQWRHGRVSVRPGHFSFQRYAFQLRIPSGEPSEFEVQEIGDDVGRRPGLRQIWRLNPQLHILEVHTDRGLRELAALPSALMELRERLDAAEPKAAP